MPKAQPNSRRRFRPLIAIAGLAVLLGAAGGSEPKGRVAPGSRSASTEPTVDKPARPASLATFATWVSAAGETFTRVRDYQGTFAKRERIDGVLQEEQTAQLKVRCEPFSVHVKFTAPRSVAGKEGSYVQGRNGGKLRAKSGGALGLVGYVTLDPQDPRAMQGSRHSITEIGLGNFVEQLGQAIAPQPGRMGPEVLVSEYTINRRPCVRFDLTDASADGKKSQYRTVVYFDNDTNLPVRYEAYDRRGDMVESFAYFDLRFNVGLADSSFP